MREDLGMGRSQLDAYDESEPIGGFVAQLAAERFTGQADVGTSPRAHLYAIEGRIYLAERDGDPPIQSRFVTMGVVSPDQLARGAVQVGDSVSLAQLFDSDPNIDRAGLVGALEQTTAQTLGSLATAPAGTVTLHPLRHHPSGINQWLDSSSSRSNDTTVPPPPRVSALAGGLAPPPFGSTPSEPPPQAAVVPADRATLPTLGSWTPPTAEERLKTTENRFTPTGFSAFDLPKLASRPMSVSEITVAQAIIKADAEQPSITVPDDASSLSDAWLQELDKTTSNDTTSNDTTLNNTTLNHTALAALAGNPTFAELVKTPPSNPTVDTPTDIDSLLSMPSTAAGGTNGTSNGTTHHESDLTFDSASWTPPTSPKTAAEEIWSMVDELLRLEHQQDELAMSGAPDDEETRGRRRGKKG